MSSIATGPSTLRPTDHNGNDHVAAGNTQIGGDENAYFAGGGRTQANTARATSDSVSTVAKEYGPDYNESTPFSGKLGGNSYQTPGAYSSNYNTFNSVESGDHSWKSSMQYGQGTPTENAQEARDGLVMTSNGKKPERSEAIRNEEQKLADLKEYKATAEAELEEAEASGNTAYATALKQNIEKADEAITKQEPAVASLKAADEKIETATAALKAAETPEEIEAARTNLMEAEQEAEIAHKESSDAFKGFQGSLGYSHENTMKSLAHDGKRDAANELVNETQKVVGWAQGEQRRLKDSIAKDEKELGSVKPGSEEAKEINARMERQKNELEILANTEKNLETGIKTLTPKEYITFLASEKDKLDKMVLNRSSEDQEAARKTTENYNFNGENGQGAAATLVEGHTFGNGIIIKEGDGKVYPANYGGRESNAEFAFNNDKNSGGKNTPKPTTLAVPVDTASYSTGTSVEGSVDVAMRGTDDNDAHRSLTIKVGDTVVAETQRTDEGKIQYRTLGEDGKMGEWTETDNAEEIKVPFKHTVSPGEDATVTMTSQGRGHNLDEVDSTAVSNIDVQTSEADPDQAAINNTPDTMDADGDGDIFNDMDDIPDTPGVTENGGGDASVGEAVPFIPLPLPSPVMSSVSDTSADGGEEESEEESEEEFVNL